MAIGRTNAGGGGSGDCKAFLDGTLTEFSAKKTKVSTLAPYRFYNFKNLTSANFVGVTQIPDYTCYGATALTSIALDTNTSQIGAYAFNGCTALEGEISFTDCAIGSNAFYSTKISKISGNATNIGSQAFYGNSSLKTVDLKINGSLGEYNFYNSNITNLTIDPDSVITSLGGYAFRDVGDNRTAPESNVFTLDFRNSTFTSIGSYCFYSTKYLDIFFPSTLGTISNSSQFASSQNLNIYYNSVPTLGGTGVFSSIANVKNFFPYDLVRTAKNATNWVSGSIVGTIYGYAPANVFIQGQELPVADDDGYALTWYSDIAMTSVVTMADNPAQIYYCQVGARTFTKLAKVTKFQANCVVSDGAKTYAEGALIQIGTALTITATGEGANTEVYQFTLNGENITSGYEYTVGEDNISIVCIYWDGVNVPVNPTFSENTPAQIKVGIDTGVGKSLWTIGDKKTITLTDGTTCNLVLLDLTENRYEKSDGSGHSNGVLGFEEITQMAQMNSTSTNVGGWAESKMYTETMPQVLATLPQEWRDVISTVKVASTIGGAQTSVSYSDNTVFLPAIAEVFDPAYDSRYNVEGTIFEYYKGSGSGSGAIRIKQYNGNNYYWWLRSPYVYNSSGFMRVRANGDWNYGVATNTNGVSACFAI